MGDPMCRMVPKTDHAGNDKIIECDGNGDGVFSPQACNERGASSIDTNKDFYTDGKNRVLCSNDPKVEGQLGKPLAKMGVDLFGVHKFIGTKREETKWASEQSSAQLNRLEKKWQVLNDNVLDLFEEVSRLKLQCETLTGDELAATKKDLAAANKTYLSQKAALDELGKVVDRLNSIVRAAGVDMLTEQDRAETR